MRSTTRMPLDANASEPESYSGHEVEAETLLSKRTTAVRACLYSAFVVSYTTAVAQETGKDGGNSLNDTRYNSKARGPEVPCQMSKLAAR